MFSDPPRATNPAAKQILQICATGHYEAPPGVRVSIEQELNHANAGTRLYSPEQLELLRGTTPTRAHRSTAIEVIDATTQRAAQTLAMQASTTAEAVVVLNFASPRNPGGRAVGCAKDQDQHLCR